MDEFVSPCYRGYGFRNQVGSELNPVKDDSIVLFVLCCDHLSFTSSVRFLTQRPLLMGGRWKMSLWSLKWADI